MGGTPKPLGPFKGGLNNAAGSGEYINDDELFRMDNLEVDVNGSLANRPAIRMLSTAIGSALRILGTYRALDGNNFLCVAVSPTTMRMINAVTGATASSIITITSVCAIQWLDKMFVVPQLTMGGGGYFTYSAGSFTWVVVATMPPGESATIYRERLFIAAGQSSTSNSSNLYFSATNNGASWGVLDYTPVEEGNGEKLTCIIGMANDILCFKEHSTFRFGYQSDVLQAELSKISNTIGVPNFACAATYDNNNIYLLHGDSVYELFNYSFTDISQKIKFRQELDATLLNNESFGLTVYRDRLFVRYYAELYVYNVKNQTWSTWSSSRKFSRLYVIPSDDIGLDFAFAHPATNTNNGKLYFFQDDRVLGVGGSGNTGESFQCTITTKTYDYDTSFQFKVQYYWSANIATSGNTIFSTMIPNASKNPTWDEVSTRTWDEAALTTWDVQSDIAVRHTEGAGLGAFSSKHVKLEKKIRFRRVYYTLESAAIANTIADASVRIYDMVAFVDPKERISKRVS